MNQLLAIAIGGIPVALHGAPVPGYDEAPVAAHMKGLEVSIAVDVGVGDGRATVWTCDLTHGYIEIGIALSDAVHLLVSFGDEICAGFASLSCSLPLRRDQDTDLLA